MLSKQHWRVARCCWRNISHACVNLPILSWAALLALKSVDLLLQFGSVKNLVRLLLSIGQEVREPLRFCASHSLQVRITLIESCYLENYYVRQRKVITLSISNCYHFFLFSLFVSNWAQFMNNCTDALDCFRLLFIRWYPMELILMCNGSSIFAFFLCFFAACTRKS